ncbi:MAG: diaminopimelate dehydrogenase [Bacteroidales bacterium]|nr:diaminopimelate dehydrogenase [Bacteroidales bacterium]
MIRLGIVGMGNLGRGVQRAIAQNPDTELVAIFSRRAQPEQASATPPTLSLAHMERYKGQIDVMLLCGGSATDLPEQSPAVAELFNTVDSFDTHARIPEHFARVDNAARQHGHLCLISAGWDPGLFSLMRLLGQSTLPQGADYTFWGRGVSQGHSDAIRRISGVADAKQYTIPIDEALAQVRSGAQPTLSTAQKHTRECYVVPEPGADLSRIEQEIKQMPNYFADYHTTVHFVSAEELQAHHSGMPHGGMVLRTGTTSPGTKQRMEFGLQLDSNPEFTASVLVAYARAVARMAQEGQTGARTVFDIAPSLLAPLSAQELRQHLL